MAVVVAVYGIIQSRLWISLISRKLIVLCDSIADIDFPTVRIVVNILLNWQRPSRVRYDPRGTYQVREVVMNSVGGDVATCYSSAIEVHVLRQIGPTLCVLAQCI